MATRLKDTDVVIIALAPVAGRMAIYALAALQDIRRRKRLHAWRHVDVAQLKQGRADEFLHQFSLLPRTILSICARLSF